MVEPLFFILRHGETNSNKDNKYRGWSNEAPAQLSPEGKEGVRESAQFLKKLGYKFPIIICDDLNRTQETAKITADILGIAEIETVPEMKPLNVGDFTGKSKEDNPVEPYLQNPDIRIPGGESHNEFDVRMAKVFSDILELVENIKQPILLIGHGSTVSFLHNHMTKKPGVVVGYEGLVKPSGVLVFTVNGIIPLTKLRNPNIDSEYSHLNALALLTTGVRDIDSPETDGDGHFLDTGEYDQVKEAHRRDGFFKIFQYSDTAWGDPRIFDPNGLYICKDCNKWMEWGGCTLVEGSIDGEQGSCRHWENKCAGDPELEMATKISKDLADYGETPNVGFSCKRCEYHSIAKATDSQGRPLFCNQGAFRVMGDACCALNDTKGMKTDFKEGS